MQPIIFQRQNKNKTPTAAQPLFLRCIHPTDASYCSSSQSSRPQNQAWFGALNPSFCFWIRGKTPINVKADRRMVAQSLSLRTFLL